MPTSEAAATWARKTWRTLEPIHGMIYFAPEAAARYEALGLHGRSGYFASRSAPMGPVGAPVVVATFYNFEPGLVRESMAGVWERTTPASLLDARLAAADAALRRALPDGWDAEAMRDAAALARHAAEVACEHREGRPLFAGHAELPWPDDDHLVLWHAQTLLREFRGDGHIAELVIHDFRGIDALVLHAATGEVPRGTASHPPLGRCRVGGVGRRARAAWLAPTGRHVHRRRTGRARRDRSRDRPARERAVRRARRGRLRPLARTARPWSKAIVASGLIGFDSQG